MIDETSASDFMSAMNAAFDAAFSAARDPRVANYPSVMEALARARKAKSDALAATQAVQAATGLFGSIKATMAASKAVNKASVAEANLRTAIEQVLTQAA